MQYPKLCRRPDAGRRSGEQVLLDGNELAGDSPYFAFGVVDATSRSPARRVLHRLRRRRDVHRSVQGSRLGELLPDVIEGTYYGSAWATDNATFFYTTIDDAHRPYRVWRHRLGTASADDVIVYEEDRRAVLRLARTQPQRALRRRVVEQQDHE